MQNREIIDFFEKNRLFEESEELYEKIIPKLSEFQNILVNSEDIEDFVILMFGLNDETKMFEITQILIESISLFYYKFKQDFFDIFLKNLKIIHPHAIKMTANVLSPILYEDDEARQNLCKSLEFITNENLLIFKEVYLKMIEEDSAYNEECILKRLKLIA